MWRQVIKMQNVKNTLRLKIQRLKIWTIGEKSIGVTRPIQGVVRNRLLMLRCTIRIGVIVL